MLASVRSRPMARPAAEACGYPPPLVLRLAQRPGAAGPAGLSRWAREHRLSCGSMGPALADRKALSAHRRRRSEEHTSELQSLMRISYAVFCLKKKTKITQEH